MRFWPDAFSTPIGPGFMVSPADMKLRTEMEVGPALVRRLSRARLDQVQGVWRMTDAEFGTFRAWFEDAPWSLGNHSDDLNGWTAFQTTWTPGAAVGPFPQPAGLLAETDTFGNHNIRRLLPGLPQNDVITVTCSLRAAGRNAVGVRIQGHDGVNRVVNLDLSLGTVITTFNSPSAWKITPRGGGWYRASVTASLGVGGGTTPAVRFHPLGESGELSFAGNPALGIEICEVNIRRGGAFLTMPTDAAGAIRGAAGGSAWFQVPLALGDGLRLYEGRFTQTFEAEVLPGQNWNISAPLEVRDA